MRGAFTFAALIAFFPVSADAATFCATKEHVTGKLKKDYQEVRVFEGLANGKFVMELWLNPYKQTWTIVRVDTAGRACIMSTGTGIPGLLIPAET